MKRDSRIYVAGHRGLVGSAIVRSLKQQGFHNLLLRTHDELDLCEGRSVDAFFASTRPEYVFLAAAKVGGILANDSRPAEFICENLAIATNVIHSAWRHEVRKLLFLGSSCIYPKLAPQPLREEYLLSGPLEPTNEWYAVAKIAGIKMCQAYRRQYGFDAISVLPTNVYGPGDNFDLETSHVVPALLNKIETARVAGADHVTVWGSGTPRREFIYADDLAEACLLLMERYENERPINIGCGSDVTIRALAETIARVVEYRGKLRFDPTRPDGTPRKVLDVSRINALGWRPRLNLEAGLHKTCDWYREHVAMRPGAGRSVPPGIRV